ncbi:hypothetical protein IT402_00500 [Candidatus Nomurabacteria bacterium]|nr:hypothetical protein [Candidatus Nomurabacteria bacterium]
MNPFKLLQIRKNINEARENPSVFAGEQAKGFLWGLFLLPVIVCFLVVGIFFIIGYTELFGFQAGFFKFLFWVSLVVSFIVLSLLRMIVRTISKNTSNQTKKVIDAIVVEKGD